MSRFATVTVTGQTKYFSWTAAAITLECCMLSTVPTGHVVNVVLDFHLNSYFYVRFDMYCLILISRISVKYFDSNGSLRSFITSLRMYLAT